MRQFDRDTRPKEIHTRPPQRLMPPRFQTTKRPPNPPFEFLIPGSSSIPTHRMTIEWGFSLQAQRNRHPQRGAHERIAEIGLTDVVAVPAAHEPQGLDNFEVWIAERFEI